MSHEPGLAFAEGASVISVDKAEVGEEPTQRDKVADAPPRHPPVAVHEPDDELAHELAVATDGLRALIDLSPHPVLTFDPAGCVTSISRAAERVFGLVASDVVGKPLPITFETGPDRPLAMEEFEDVTRPMVRHGLLRAGGKAWRVALSQEPVRDAAGAVSDMMGLIVDQTEEHAMRASLYSLEQHFCGLIGSSPDGIVAFDMDLEYTFWSPSMETIVGLSAARAVGRSVLDVPPFVGLGDEADAMRRALGGKVTVLPPGPLGLQGEDNHQMFESTFFPIRDQSERVVGGMAMIHDVTAQQRARARESLLSTAVENAAECIIITDTDGRIRYLNPAFERTSGYTREEALGRNPSLLASGQQDAGFFKEMWDTITSGRVWTGRFTNRKKDGSLYEEEGSISPVLDDNGNPVRFVSVTRDVSREVELERRLRQRDKIDSISSLAGSVVHELSDPLAYVVANLGFLERELSGTEAILPTNTFAELMEILKDAREGARKIRDIVRRIKPLSHIDERTPHAVDVEAVLERALRIAGDEIDEHAKLVRDYAPDVRPVLGREGPLTQVLLNLLLNAAQALVHGEPNEIRVSIENGDDNTVRIGVADTGRGVAEGHTARLFDPFFTTKGEPGAKGLGLCICHSLVTSMRGTIDVLPRPERGTMFVIVLPAVEPPSVAE